jgi:molecular chaperone GrpE
MNEEMNPAEDQVKAQEAATAEATGDQASLAADEATGEQIESTDQTDETAEAVTTDWQDKYVRLYAEFDNFRRRTNRERLANVQNASRSMIEMLLPVLDDFDRALAANKDAEGPLLEGVTLVNQKLIGLMEGRGLKPMDAMGKPFDTDHHEAVTQIPAPTRKQVGKVVDVLERGYFLNDAVLRYAKVVVGK